MTASSNTALSSTSVSSTSLSNTTSTGLRALVVDWGGLLTAPLRGAMAAWCDAEGVDRQHWGGLLREWRLAQAEAGEGPEAGPVAELERGEITAEEFETLVADELGRRGSPVSAAGLLGRMLGGLEQREEAMFDLVRRAKEAGLRTALLSNSWGNTYDRTGWEVFDAVVISGEVGMRKPERRIFAYTSDLLELSPAQCVLVDDLPWNIDGARAAGMAAVLHEDVATTAARLEEMLAVRLR
jgi:putative hydrolase of the HAD superfamily